MPQQLGNTFLGLGAKPVTSQLKSATKSGSGFLSLLAIGVLCAGFAHAEPIAYSAQEDQLIRLDLATGQISTVGTFGSIANTPFLDVEGLAFDFKGGLFAVSDLTETLMRVQIGNGRAQSVGNIYGLGLQGQGVGLGNNLDFGLSFTCDGNLWLSSDSVGKLWQVDQSSGVAHLVGSMDVAISGLAAYGDQLFGIGVGADEGLYRIDTLTAQTTLIGRLGLGYPFYDAGLDFDADGNLWGVLDFNPPPSGRDQDYRVSEIVRINLNNGQAGTPVKVVGPREIEIESLAIAPTSCPDGAPPEVPIEVPVGSRFGSILLGLMLALLGAAWVRRR